MKISSEDDRAIRALVARCESAWNASDSAGFTATMADDINFINVLGDRYHGREIVERGHRHIFDTIFKDSRLRYTIDEIRLLRADVALVVVHQHLTSHLPASAISLTTRQMQVDKAMHESEARGTMVLAKDGGQWRMIAFQNTGVAFVPTTRA